MSEINRPLLCLLAACWLLFAARLNAQVVINEIHYEPENKTAAEEFIELYNASEAPVDLSGWYFSNGIIFTFPDGTLLPAGDYLVVAEDPAVLADNLSFEGASGPWEGRLDNGGETLTLRDATGARVDEVDYQAGFPWPLAAQGKGSSMELLHPGSDNNLAGSWRASGLIERPFTKRVYFLRGQSEDWRYRPGTSEASDPPQRWREDDFPLDETWLQAQTAIGFGDGDDNTELADMRRSYTSIYMRHTFTIDNADSIPDALVLNQYIDDGAVVWINGTEVLRYNMEEGELAFDDDARGGREARWIPVTLPNPAAYLRQGENLVAVHGFNTSLNSSDVSLDFELYSPGTEDEDPNALLPPSPGARNTVFSTNPGPLVRQVEHSPKQPVAGEALAVTAKITDPQGLAAVSLRYQIVQPGNYIPAFLAHPHNILISQPARAHEPNPDFEDPANWTTLQMSDDGRDGDEIGGDGIYSVLVPGQGNRTLLRYRITASDTADAQVTVPYKDDPSLNFAAFFYNGVPAYTASRTSVHPEGAGHTYSAEEMAALPVYTLITLGTDMTHCVGYSGSFQIPKSNEPARDHFNWEGAFVYDGEVYDHVRYRLRQANDRYGGSGKRSMRIRFPKGHYLKARDNYGKRYPTRWRTLNTGKMFDNKRVGNFGVTESMNSMLWNMVGVPAPHFNTFHFRVISGEDEVPAGSYSQYLGDFWGMYVGIEDYDPRFLDAHGLEDGNLYKLKDGQFNGNDLRRNQGRYAITTDADFQNIRRNLRPQRNAEWLDAHVNYDKWYPYHAVVEGIRHYDFRPADSHSKNRAWYFEPDDRSNFGRLWTMPWDSDASWGPNWNSGVDYSKDAIFGSGGKAEYKQKYRNFIREFRDLIWTQTVLNQMIDDLGERIEVFSMADRDRWRNGPTQAGRQDFGTLATKINDMKRFAFIGWSGSTGPSVPAGGRARHLENLANSEGDRTRIPATPTVVYAGPEDFPANALLFNTQAFNDPQDDAFAAMKWRLGEVTPTGAPFDPDEPRRYEWPSTWELESEQFSPLLRLPRSAVQVGKTYRVRLKVKDDTQKWSHWSNALEFTVSAPTALDPVQSSLRITELMFNPRGDEGFEFIELQNTGTRAIDLSEAHFSNGIDFSFAGSAVEELAAGAYVLVVRNRAAFASRYDTSNMLIAGEYSGRLSNGGERVALSFGSAETITDFEYDDEWFPGADGTGFSMVIIDPLAPAESWSEAASWRLSNSPDGSPGSDDSAPTGGSQLPGDLSQDGSLNITDAVVHLGQLFGGAPRPLPCADGVFGHPSNQALMDVDGDQQSNLTDAVFLLLYLFNNGAPPALGTECLRLADCPDVCVP